MESDRPDAADADNGGKAALMGAAATEVEQGPTTAAETLEGSAPPVASGNAFAR